MSPDDPHPAAPLRIVITDEVGRSLRKPSLSRWLRAVAPVRARGSVAVALVSDAAMRRLNRQYAGVDDATDVLSFSTGETRFTPARAARSVSSRSRRASGLVTPTSALRPSASGHRTRGRHLGDIAIATGVARRQARGAGHSVDTELRILALHGLLHLLGFDHTADDGTMARLEGRLRRKGGLPEGLIDRAGARTRR